jgi:hypothetical protein
MKNEESGREFSTVWKMFFHGVEKTGPKFPRYGKKFSGFSTVWKTVAAALTEPRLLAAQKRGAIDLAFVLRLAD